MPLLSPYVLHAPPIILVKPEYRSKIETADELDSDKIYGYNAGLDIASHSILYPKLSEFNESNKLWEDRGDSKKRKDAQKITKSGTVWRVPLFV